MSRRAIRPRPRRRISTGRDLDRLERMVQTVVLASQQIARHVYDMALLDRGNALIVARALRGLRYPSGDHQLIAADTLIEKILRIRTDEDGAARSRLTPPRRKRKITP